MRSAIEPLGLRPLSGTATIAAWDAYCRRHPRATPYHGAAWCRAVTAALGHEHHGLHAGSAERITGVLPLHVRRSRWFGTSLVSVPAANVGGPLADDDVTARRLVEGAIAVTRELQAGYLEIRDIAPSHPAAGMLTLDAGRYATVVLPIGDGESAAWGRIRKEVRRRIRRAQEAGVTVEIGQDLDAFYAVYASTMKRLGSPPFSERFFSALHASFPDSLRIGVARVDGALAAVDLMLTHGDVGYSVFAGSRARFWEHSPNQVLLWEEIRDACARRLRAFDLGRSLVGSGALDFKLAWGGSATPLTYGYFLHRTRRLPVRTPDMRLYRALGRIWSHLPEGVTTAVGPHIVKHLF